MADTKTTKQFQEEVTFSFGKNWLDFSKNLPFERITEAKESLRRLLKREYLKGLSFIDIGSGSGIVSIAALMLGAEQVLSLDKDPASVEATKKMLEKIESDNFSILEASILDDKFISSLPQFDVVYSWGVLHHTGDMWKAIKNASKLIKPNGLFAIAIYNKTAFSNFWLKYKRVYNKAPGIIKFLMTLFLFLPRAVIRLIKFKNPIKGDRGMSIWYDARDWAGGLPYEFASFEEIISFMENKGFELINSTRTNRLGCNEFLFIRK